MESKIELFLNCKHYRLYYRRPQIVLFSAGNVMSDIDSFRHCTILYTNGTCCIHLNYFKYAFTMQLHFLVISLLATGTLSHVSGSHNLLLDYFSCHCLYQREINSLRSAKWSCYFWHYFHRWLLNRGKALRSLGWKCQWFLSNKMHFVYLVVVWCEVIASN